MKKIKIKLNLGAGYPRLAEDQIVDVPSEEVSRELATHLIRTGLAVELLPDENVPAEPAKPRPVAMEKLREALRPATPKEVAEQPAAEQPVTEADPAAAEVTVTTGQLVDQADDEGPAESVALPPVKMTGVKRPTK